MCWLIGHDDETVKEWTHWLVEMQCLRCAKREVIDFDLGFIIPAGEQADRYATIQASNGGHNAYKTIH